MGNWKSKIKIYILIIQTIILLGGFIIGYIELRNLKTITSGNLSLELYKNIRSDHVFMSNPKIIEGIYNSKNILVENGGIINEEDLDNYLNLFEWIAAANELGVLTDDMVYNFHGDLIIATFDNIEIRNYLDTIRKEDKAYYQSFINLVVKMKEIDKQKVD